MEWVDTHGARFDHMIVFDADSVMSGDTMVRLAALMEASPRTGIIQTHAVAMGRETLFARVLQFSSRLYGGMLATGHSFWQMGEAELFRPQRDHPRRGLLRALPPARASRAARRSAARS